MRWIRPLRYTPKWTPGLPSTCRSHGSGLLQRNTGGMHRYQCKINMCTSSRVQKDLFQDIGSLDESDGDSLISLSMGAPGLAALDGCNDIMLEATKRTLRKEEERYIFQYGPLRGDPDFLQVLASFLSQQYGSTVNSNNLMVNAGATQGIHLVTTVMFNQETPIFVEDPTFFLAINMLRKDLGRRVIPVQTDKDGILPSALERAIVEHTPTCETKTPFKALVYLITTLNNPRGFSSSQERCRELITLARKYDVLLLTDDVYNLLYYRTASPQRLLTYDDPNDADFKGNVLSNASFSKVFGPGIRLGWIEAPQRVLQYLDNCSITRSGGCYNHYTAWVMSSALREGDISQHLTRLRDMYKRRMDVLCDQLSDGFPVEITFQKPEGGFFLWIELPGNASSTKLLKIAEEKYGLNFITGPSTSPTGSFTNCIRLSVSYYDEDRIIEGVNRLKNAVREYEQIRNSSNS